MANILGFLKAVTLQLKGNWPDLRGMVVPPGLALQAVLTQGASQAPVLVRVQTLQREGTQHTQGSRGFTPPNYTSHQTLAQYFQIKCGVTFSLIFSVLIKNNTFLFFKTSIYLAIFLQERLMFFF